MTRESFHILQRRIARCERPKAVKASHVPLGHGELDHALGGGLARGRLHEMLAGEAGEGACAAGFAAMLACRIGGTIVWLREEGAERRCGALHGPGLAELGLAPHHLVIGRLPDAKAVLRAAEDVARCPAIGSVIVELWGNPRLLDLTATRRLALAAETSGVTPILLRVAADPAPSAAQTRWRARPALSSALEAKAPGPPAIDVELMRQKGRSETGRWRLEWNRDHHLFNSDASRQALPGALVSLASGRTAVPGEEQLRRVG